MEHLGYRRLSKDLRAYPVQGCPGSVPHPWTLSVNHGYHIGKNSQCHFNFEPWVPTRTIHNIAWNKTIFVVIEIGPPWMIVLILILISSQSAGPGRLR
jgi:hypothetical protein